MTVAGILVYLLALVYLVSAEVPAQGVSFSNSDGFVLLESLSPHEVCVNIFESPMYSDLTVEVVGIGFSSAASPSDFIAPATTLTFTTGTSELQQCFNITVFEDQVIETTETFLLVANPSTGSPASQFVSIESPENESALIGFSQEVYLVEEGADNVTVCVVFLEGSGIEDPSVSVDVFVSILSESTTGEDFVQSMPLSVTLTSNTPPTGACADIDISSDDGVEAFTISLSPSSDRVMVIGGEDIARVVVLIEELPFCEPLAGPENGVVNVTTRTVGSVAMYACEDQFVLNGDSQRTCQEDGEWSGEAPTCLATCGDLEGPENGAVMFSDPLRVVGSVANYSCNESYMLEGDSQRTCLLQNPAMWSGEAPTCVPVPTTTAATEATTTIEEDDCPLDFECTLRSKTRSGIESRLGDSGDTYEECRSRCADAFEQTPKKTRRRGRGRKRMSRRRAEDCDCFCATVCREARPTESEFTCQDSLEDTCEFNAGGKTRSLKTKDIRRLLEEVDSGDCQEQCESVLLSEKTPKSRTLERGRRQCRCFCFYHRECLSMETEPATSTETP